MASDRIRRETPVEIVRQGAIRVGRAWVEAEGAEVVAIGLDCASKYYEVQAGTSYTGSHYEGWTLYLTACEETMHMAEGVDRNVPTEVILPEFRAGWRPWVYSRSARYDVSICLVRAAD
jgi:hypothetical protein